MKLKKLFTIAFGLAMTMNIYADIPPYDDSTDPAGPEQGMGNHPHRAPRRPAITVDNWPGASDFSSVAALCDSLEIPYLIKDTQIGEIIFHYRREKNPCALCAKMRRAVLANTCAELNCSKLALGHHREDAVATLLLSLLHEGRFHTFHPCTRMSRTGITVIRPLVYLPESHVKHMMKVLSLPVVTSSCPVNGQTERETVSRLLAGLKTVYPDLNERILHALQHEPYDLWQKSSGSED